MSEWYFRPFLEMVIAFLSRSFKFTAFFFRLPWRQVPARPRPKATGFYLLNLPMSSPSAKM